MALEDILKELGTLELQGAYERDFLGPETRTDQELAGLFAAADALRELRGRNYDTRVFRSGLALWAGSWEDAGYAPFAAGCAMVGLQAVAVGAVDEEKLAGGMPDALSGPDGETCAALAAMAGGLYQRGRLTQRPVTVRVGDGLGFGLELIRRCGGAEHLRGRAVTVVPGPGDREALEVCSRLGLEVAYAGDLSPEEEARLAENARRTGGGLHREETPAVTGQLRWPEEAPGGESHLPYLTAAAIFLAKAPNPAKLFEDLKRAAQARRLV